MLVVIFVIKVSVVQGVVRGREAQLPPSVQLVLPLLGVELSFFQQASEGERGGQVRRCKHASQPI